MCKQCSFKNGIEKIKERHHENFNDPIKKSEILEKRKNTCIQKYECEYASQYEGIKTKIKDTFIKKYNGHPLQCQFIKEKIKNTNLKKYNKINTFQVEKFKEKGKQTSNEKYGTDYPIQNKEIQEKRKETSNKKYGTDYPIQNEEIKEQMKQSNLIKYNKEYTLQVNEIREKGKETMMTKYNVDNAMKSLIIKEKVKNTNLEKYDKINVFQVEKFKEKMKETSQKRYGTDHPMQNKNIMEKSFNASFKKKSYTLPSGKVIEYQGYENFALDDLLKSYNETEIVNGSQNVPELWYETNGKKHCHYVDFYIPKENKCIEVKSIFTLKSKKITYLINNNMQKNKDIYMKYGYMIRV